MHTARQARGAFDRLESERVTLLGQFSAPQPD